MIYTKRIRVDMNLWGRVIARSSLIEVQVKQNRRLNILSMRIERHTIIFYIKNRRNSHPIREKDTLMMTYLNSLQEQKGIDIKIFIIWDLIRLKRSIRLKVFDYSAIYCSLTRQEGWGWLHCSHFCSMHQPLSFKAYFDMSLLDE